MEKGGMNGDGKDEWRMEGCMEKGRMNGKGKEGCRRER